MIQARRRLRIGIVTDGLVERQEAAGATIANGGVGVYIYQLVKHLQALDVPADFFLIRYGLGKLDIYRNGERRNVFLSPPLLGPPVDLAHRSLIGEVGLDLIHYPNQFGGLFLRRGTTCVVTLHDLTPLLFPAFHPRMRVQAYRLLLRGALHRARAIIVDAAHTRDALLARRLAPAARITVVPLAADERFRPGVRTADFLRRYDLPERFILNVGVLEPRKNHRVLIEALAHLHAAGERIGLVLVGRDGWSWRDPLDEPAFAHLRPWVRIHRNVPDEDLPELYDRADVLAYPSLYEGFGLPVLEAMACATPVVASNTSSLPEVAGGAALLVDPTDADDLARRLLDVLRDPDLRAHLIGTGRRRASEFSWRRTANETFEVYRRVCEARSGSARDDSPDARLGVG